MGVLYGFARNSVFVRRECVAQILAKFFPFFFKFAVRISKGILDAAPTDIEAELCLFLFAGTPVLIFERSQQLNRCQIIFSLLALAALFKETAFGNRVVLAFDIGRLQIGYIFWSVGSSSGPRLIISSSVTSKAALSSALLFVCWCFCCRLLSTSA